MPVITDSEGECIFFGNATHLILLRKFSGTIQVDDKGKEIV
jgi:hypothetical protein